MTTTTTARAAILSPIALAAQGGAPEWVQILPAGPELVAVDGRRWTLTDAAAVARASLANGLPLPIDWEHGQDLKADKGERADAAGWIEELQVREDGTTWARVVWTDEGAQSVASRAYRFLSPAFRFGKSTAREVKRIVGAGLVNRPAFPMTALASEQDTDTDDNEDIMDKDILDALGLAHSSTKADAIASIGKLKGDCETALAAAKHPPLERFIPRADYDAVEQRAVAAEQKLAERDAAETKAKAETLVDEAVKAGKIAPVSKDHYLALAAADYSAVESLLKVTPSIIKQSDLDKLKASDGTTTLDESERAICRQLNISEESYLKQKAADAAA